VPGVTAVPAVSVNATVNAENGLNVRAEPNIESEVLIVLDHEQEVIVTGRSATSGDADWVELDSGGWVQSQFLVFD
jgi:predicted secreted Zn-dependent protease